ncbi:MAG: sigma 54-interacting transcriptional regulator [Deltaproteobacteria bacterium]|nr:sigma 54-interacting transcriptional regulator [Deltaproteobacteria bacterium]MBW1929957.1 sigma 54-interacting transcriptional regulator [Deltaproteobacteria bacterium]MBW2026874.1 sigma 54-interacting transcriptional regulator [Deltaproteobacteria bacterium]MBW2127189.1 sigma 54-interacting transcriptional regulator [Deltaproteobacteria bacterium]
MQDELSRLLAEQENLHRIIDNLLEGIIAHDKQRRIVYFNRTAEKITGYRREEVLGRDCHDVFGGPFCGGRCSFKEGAPLHWEDKAYPLTILTKQGEPKRLEMRVTGMADNKGEFYGVLASFRDVTDLITLKIRSGELKEFHGIIGQDSKMLEIYRQIRDVAANDYPVHISGETGTGKELVAVAIHKESRRGGGPFVPVNCGALPEGVLESELFGHVKGAFSGAIRDKKGRFELAHEGTLFLDEVAELPKPVQVKLLRVLQDGTFEQVGSEKSISVNVRIISATNKDLKKEVKEGRFRDDLFYRINVVPIQLPPLRERKGDIPILVEHFIQEAKHQGYEVSGLSHEAMALFVSYPWPGNVRELQSAVRFALIRSKGMTIQPEHLPLELRQWQSTMPQKGRSRKLDILAVREALERTGGNKAKAARLLGVGRATLYRFLQDHPSLT